MDEKINWTTFGLIALVLFIIYTVNPYVTGSSPVARATDFRHKPRRFVAFSLLYTVGNYCIHLPLNTPKYNRKIIYQLYQNFCISSYTLEK